MTFFTTTFNKNSPRVSDGWIQTNFLEHGGFKFIGEETLDINSCDVVVYFRYIEKNFTFDTDLADIVLKLNKKIIIFDYIEYAVQDLVSDDYLNNYDILGYKVDNYFLKQLDDYYGGTTINDKIEYFTKFSDKGLIYCYFKRELSRFLELQNIGFSVYPCEFFRIYDESLISNNKHEKYIDYNEFNESRPIPILHACSENSHVDRSILSGAILMRREKFGVIATSKTQLEHFANTDIAGISVVCRSEEYDRIDYDKFLPLSRGAVDLYGCGMKCFRNVESAMFSTSFKQDPSLLVHAYPWIHDENCIFLPNKNGRLDANLSADIIYEYTRGGMQHKLLKIFKKSQDTAIKYTNEKYTLDYILPKISGAFTER